MDIKLKNKYLYRIALVLSIYMFAISLIAAIDFVKFKDYLISKPYFSSTSFKNEVNTYFKTELTNYFRNLKEYYVDYKNYDKKSEDDKIDKEQMDLDISYDRSILNSKSDEIEHNYKVSIDEAEKAGDKDKANILLMEKNKKLDEAKSDYNATIERRKRYEISQKDSMYNYLKKYISSRNYIKYYIKDNATGDTYTNLDGTNISNYIQKNSLYTIKLPQVSATDDYVSSISNGIKNFRFEGYFVIPQKLEGYNQIDDSYNSYTSIRASIIKYTLNKEELVFIVSLAIGITLLLYLRRINEIETDLTKKLRASWRNIPLDIKVITFIISTLLILFYFINMPFFYSPFNLNHIFSLTIMAIYCLYYD